MKIIGMIPARYASTRLEGKALADIGGKTMTQHVYERAARAVTLTEVVVATDDERIARAVEAFGGRWEMTASSHQSGTDRLAEVAARTECDIIVNIQGDEPMIEPGAIDAAVGPFLEPGCHERLGTIATRITDLAEHLEPSTVKVVVDGAGHALYFSRAPIPYFRLEAEDDWPLDRPRRHPASGLWPLKHIGLYVYTRETLLWYAGLPQSPLEKTEKLEQLRALDNGCPIRVVEVDYSPIGVDTPEDLRRVREIMAAE